MSLNDAEHWKQEALRLRQEAEQLAAANAALTRRNADLTARNAQLECQARELRSQAGTDVMTNIANYRAFRSQLEAAFQHARRHNTPLSLLILDVDRFKHYNDTYGHPAGDEVLRLIARRLRQQVRMFDFVARYGGEEFVVVLPGADAVGATTQAERLRHLIAQLNFGAENLTASFGVASASASVESTDALIEHADTALYACKRAGRNCVRHYDTLSVGERRQQRATKPLLSESTS